MSPENRKNLECIQLKNLADILIFEVLVGVNAVKDHYNFISGEATIALKETSELPPLTRNSGFVTTEL